MKISQLTKSLYFLIDTPGFNKDCISKGQLDSKEWLVNEVEKLDIDLGTVFLCAGWYATLATLILESDIKVSKIRSFDVDHNCLRVADKINAPWTMDKWKFKASTIDIHLLEYPLTYITHRADNTTVELCDMPDTIINTSCEHIENFNRWYNKIPSGTLVILQTNNFTEIEDHINCSSSMPDFAEKSPMTKLLFEGELPLDAYTRYMRIGLK